MPTAAQPSQPKSAVAPTPDPVVRTAVKALLTKTPAFAQLSPDRQLQTARDTAVIADYLARPEELEGIKRTPARALEGETGVDASSEKGWEAVSDIGDKKFEAGAAMAGAQVAQTFMKSVNFTEFVGGL